MIQLDLGCGPYVHDGWVSIDRIQTPGHGVLPTVFGDLRSMPFLNNSVTKVRASHVAEHIPLDVLPSMWLEVQRVLAPGGTIAVVGPDVHKARAMVEEGSQPERLLYDVGLWSDDVGLDAHYWECSEGLLLDMLRVAKFKNVRIVGPQEIIDAGFPLVSEISWQAFLLAEVDK